MRKSDVMMQTNIAYFLLIQIDRYARLTQITLHCLITYQVQHIKCIVQKCNDNLPHHRDPHLNSSFYRLLVYVYNKHLDDTQMRIK